MYSKVVLSSCLRYVVSHEELIFTSNISHQEFNARVDNYEKIQTALADTPKVFCNVYETLQCLPDDEVLYNLVNDLYDTVADSLVELLDLHMGTQKPSHSGKSPSVILRYKLTSKARQNYLLKLPSQKAKTIRDALDRIIIAKKDVQDRCEICAKKLQQEEYRLVKSSHEEGHAIRRTVVDTKVQVEDVQNRIQEQGVELQKQISLMTDGVRQDISNYHQSVQNFANDDASRLRPVVHNYFVVNYGGPMMGSIPTGVPQIPQTLSPRSMIAISRLILLLNVDRSIISNDLHETSRHGNTMPTDALSEARYLLSTPEFKHWFSNPSSSLLLVEGAHQQANKSTPLSVLCASLVTELPRLGPFQPLYFFCDQHNSDSDPLSGPKGLLRSLITQLLYQIPPAASNLTFLTRHVLHHVSKHNLNALFYTFATLVANLPASVTLVVILDSLNKYSSLPDWEADTLRLASHFRELVDVMPRHGSRLKMLITSKGKALDLGERIAREENERVKIGAGAGAGKFARSHGLGDELMRNEASGDWEWDSSVGQRGTGNGSAGTDTASWEF